MDFIIILLLILLNGVFSMSEIAIVSARKARLETAAKKGNRNAQAALKIANAPNRFFSTVQIGITLIGILTGIFSGEKITSDLEAALSKITMLQPYADTLSVAIVVLCITFFSLVLGELVPKRIGLTQPETIAKAVARPMNLLSRIAAPFVWLLTFTGDVLIKLLNIKPSAESRVTEEEIKAIIQEGTEGGAVQEIEQDIVERVFSLGDRKIASLMTHRSNVVFLELNSNAGAVQQIVNAELHSVYPVYEKDKDNIKGVVLLKDLFAHINTPDFALASYLHQPRYMNESTSAYRALELFKETKIYYGIVTDEFGQTEGIITINDVLEALVGSAADFYTDEYKIEQREDGSWLVDGYLPFADFLHYFDLHQFSAEYNFNTISGFILNKLKHIPRQGDKFSWLDYEIEIIDMDQARIDKVLVTRKGK